MSGTVDDTFDIDALIGTPTGNIFTAADLARRGFAVFPIYQRNSGEWLPIAGWPEKATTDAEQVSAWWRLWPDARVGMPAGARNGVTVLDVDRKNGKDGAATLAALGFPDLEALSPVRVRTPSGGCHLFFRHDGRLKNSAGKIGEGIDVRNDRGFVIAPGSLKGHNRYGPVGLQLGECDLPAFPEALIPPVEPERAAVEIVTEATVRQIEWAEDRLSELAGGLAATMEGGRNDALNRAAMWAGGAGAHGFLNRDAVRSVLWAAAETAGMRDSEFRTTFKSGWEAGCRKPLTEFPPSVGPDDFDDLPELAIPQPPELPGLINPALWEGQDIPEREWALAGWIPKGQATYLTGPGSAGKSLMSQQLATCISLGLPFMGVPTAQAHALYLTCEDDRDELHRRQVHVCKALGVPLSALSDKLFLASLTGETDTELCTFSDRGELRASKRFRGLEAAARAQSITFIALDNVAHLFPGNENVRHEVAAFMSLLNRLALNIGGAVLLIGHPNKAGDSFSGSTAWENQVRSRLFLTTPTEADGSILERDARVLSRQKANYAQNGGELRFYWHEWAFITEDALPIRQSPIARAAIEDEAFMRCLEKAKEERRNVSPSVSAQNYAPRVFNKMPLGKGIGVRGFEAAMHRLLDRGEIRDREQVFKRDNRNWVFGLAGVGPMVAP
jgi:RecA-family ATPase